MADTGSIDSQAPSIINQSLSHAPLVTAAPGDLKYVDPTTGYDYPANVLTDQGSEAATQRVFASLFAGLARGLGQGSSDPTARNATLYTAVLCPTFPCDSDTFVIGNYVAPKYTGGVLSNQVLVKVTDPTRAIGMVTRNYSSATTTVSVLLTSRKLSGLICDAGVWAVVTAPPAYAISAPGTAMSYRGGDGCYSSASTASAGGAGTWKGGSGGATASGTGGASGGATLGGAVGGAATTGTPGAAGTVAIAGDVGGAATAGTGNGGAGGNVTIGGGAGGTSFGGTAGAHGFVVASGVATKAAVTAVAITAATVLVQADSGGIFTVSQAAAYDIDLPSPTTGPGLRFFFSLTAPGSNNVTITVAGSAATFVGSITIDGATIVATGNTLTFASGASLLGDSIEILSIATNLYHVRAIASGTGGITIA